MTIVAAHLWIHQTVWKISQSWLAREHGRQVWMGLESLNADLIWQPVPLPCITD